MSISPSLLASARSAYRDLLRASAITFAGDAHIRSGVYIPQISSLIAHGGLAFRSKIRNEVLTYPPPPDPKQFETKINLTKEIADVLRKNVVQGVKIEEARDPESYDRFSKSARSDTCAIFLMTVLELRITEHTELGSNNTIKDPAPIESSRSARKRTR